MRLAPDRRGDLHKTGKGVENLAHLARMLEPVSGLPSFGFIPHHVSEPQCCQNITDPRHAPANGFGDFARAHLPIFCQQLNDGEGYRVSEEPTQARLPVASFFHERGLARFLNCENMKMSKRLHGLPSNFTAEGHSNLKEQLSARKRSVKLVVRSDPEPDYLLSFA